MSLPHAQRRAGCHSSMERQPRKHVKIYAGSSTVVSARSSDRQAQSIAFTEKLSTNAPCMLQVPAETFMTFVCGCIRHLLDSSQPLAGEENTEEPVGSSTNPWKPTHMPLSGTDAALCHLLLEMVPPPLCLPSAVNASQVQGHILGSLPVAMLSIWWLLSPSTKTPHLQEHNLKGPLCAFRSKRPLLHSSMLAL